MRKIFDKKNKAGFGRMGITIVVIIVAVVVALVVFFRLWLQKEEPIKIGAILSISGPGRYGGEEVRDGMFLAIHKINSRGGINGRKIELIIEDSKSNPQEGKEAFNKIEVTHYPILYVSTTSSVSMALAPLAEENKVVLVGLAAAAPKLTHRNEWVFRYWATARAVVPAILSILQKLKAKKLGILYLNDEHGTSAFELTKEKFERTGGTVKSGAFEPKESDFKDQITKLKDTEAIFTVGFSSHLKKIFKRLKEENFRGVILSTSASTGPSVRSLPEASGVYAATSIIYNPNFLFAKEVKEEYEAKYVKPFNQFAAAGYDLVKILAGLLRDKEISRESVKSLLEEGFIYPGVFGTIEVKPGEHDITFPLHPARIVDGEVEFLR